MSSCAEKTRLLIAYQEATVAHCDAVSNLVVMGIPVEEYERLSALAEQARKTAQAARVELAKHLKEHGC